jgi:uncharacterized membrane protein YoaK (UPF0700 family)
LVAVAVVEVHQMDLVTHRLVQILVLVLWVDLAEVAPEDFKQTVHKQLLRLQTLAAVAVAVDGNLIQQKLIDLVKMVQLESF